MIRAEGIKKSYAGHTALNGVDLELEPGKIFGLLGPNGAGKTTLIRILNLIIGPDEGKLWFGETPMRPEHTRHIGYLPEERGLYKKMKVGEHALYLASLKGVPEDKAKKTLQNWFERFELTGWWNKKIEELSKGMAQKVQFVCTLIHEPEVIILDEPFSGFDPVNAEIIKKEILKLRDEGKTILLSTHRMESVEELCDQIALIHQARVYIQGDVHEIKQQYKSNIWELQMQESEPALTFPGTTYLSGTAHAGSWLHRYQLEAGVSVRDWLLYCVQNGHITGFREVLPSMADIFIQTVSKTAP